MKKIFTLNIFISIFVFAYFVLAIGSGGGGGYVSPKVPRQELMSGQPQSAKSTSTPSTNKDIKPSGTSMKNIICNNFKTMNDRIRCRLSKTEDELKSEPFMPEECRNLSGSKRESCIKLYRAFYECFENNPNLDSCALKVVGLKGTNPSEWAKECKDKKGEAMNVCKKNVINKFLNYLKFYLYNLSYRLEEIKEENKNNINEIVNFIAFVETSKQKLNKAKEKDISFIITNVDNKWNELVQKLNLPKNFDQKSNLKEFIKKHDTVKNAISNIR